MKKHLLVTTLIVFQFQLLSSQNVTIPDANFKAWLVADASININADTNIQVSEAVAYNGSINVSTLSINDLTGIEAFTNITTLDCNYNNLTSLNVSANTALTNLLCADNNLTTLDISTNVLLTTLVCNHNQLTALNTSTNTALIQITCDENQITSLGLTTNTALQSLHCGLNPLTSLDLSANNALTGLSCYNNQLTTLDLSANPSLTNLTCPSNFFTTLDVSNNTALTYLSCEGNQLTSLDVSGNTQLNWLVCHHNQLSCLNVKNGNNSNFLVFHAATNPPLTCIQVDDTSYSNTNWINIDTSAYFSTSCPWNCSTMGIEDDLSSPPTFSIYPNPMIENSTIEYTLNTDANVKLEVYNIYGSKVGSLLDLPQKSGDHQYKLDAESLKSGVYLISFSVDGRTMVKRMVVSQ